MGYLCGWRGRRQEPGLTPQTAGAMLAGYGGAVTAIPVDERNAAGSLAVSKGIYAADIHVQEGAGAALVGTPEWDDKSLAEMAHDLGPATALLRAYRLYGKDLLSRLHGPFALAITDQDSALLAIDRLGIHTLSYGLRDGLLVFATSTGSVVRHPRIDGNVNPQAIFNYFYFHDIPSPGTIYSGVEKLLPGQYAAFRNGHLEKNFYWQMHYDDSDDTPYSQHRQRLLGLLESAVGNAAGNDRPATFLSGGTDSSTVTGMLARHQSNPVAAYSIGFGAAGFDEMEYARLAAQHFGATPHEYYIKPDDILEAIPVIAGMYDEPFANESAVPTYFCARLAAADGHKVILAGDGGDEIFGGNARYASQMIFEHYGRLPELLRKCLIEPLAFGLPGGDALLPVRKLRSYIRQARTPLPARLESYNFVHRQALDKMFEPDFLAGVNPQAPLELLHDTYFRANSNHPVSRMMHLDLKFTLADNDLRKVSRMCEAAGIEVRYPLLDEALVEFSGHLPVHYRVKGQKLRWFFKSALRDFLPGKIINKSKHGFGLPFGVWALSHPALKSYVDAALTSFGQRGYIQAAYIDTLRRQHAEDHPTYYGKILWTMMMLEKWFES